MAVDGQTFSKTTLTYDEARTLVDRITVHPVRLTQEHTVQGLTWLRRYGVKVLGLPEGVPEQVLSFSYAGSGAPSGYLHHSPIWTAHLGDGRSFDYSIRPWQAQHYSTGDRQAMWYWNDPA